MENIRTQELTQPLTTDGRPLTVLVPTGSMRNRMLDFLVARGFAPADPAEPERWKSQGREEKYQERDLGIWRNGAAAINVLVQERNEIPKRTVSRLLMRGEPAIGLTNSDITLTNMLDDWRSPTSLCRPDTLTAYDLPIPSGRGGGTSRWALVAQQSAFAGESVYPKATSITTLSENATLAQYFCARRIGALSEDIAQRMDLPLEINGTEEETLQDFCKRGEPTILIGVVESGRSAEARGLAWREIFRVRAQAVLPRGLVDDNPEISSMLKQAFALADSPSDFLPTSDNE